MVQTSGSNKARALCTFKPYKHQNKMLHNLASLQTIFSSSVCVQTIYLHFFVSTKNLRIFHFCSIKIMASPQVKSLHEGKPFNFDCHNQLIPIREHRLLISCQLYQGWIMLSSRSEFIQTGLETNVCPGICLQRLLTEITKCYFNDVSTYYLKISNIMTFPHNDL